MLKNPTLERVVLDKIYSDFLIEDHYTLRVILRLTKNEYLVFVFTMRLT